MDKLKKRGEKCLSTSTVTKQKDMSYNTKELQRYLVMNTAPEFFYNEQDSTLYWFDKRKSPDEVCPKRLANFEVLIKRRYNFIVGNNITERLVVTLRRLNVTGTDTDTDTNKYTYTDIDIAREEYSSLMKFVREIPGYFLYADIVRPEARFVQYLSEVYDRVASQIPIETVYGESGWHQTEAGAWHYYSGNDVNNCFSDFRLANNISYEPSDLMEWGIGLMSISEDRIMLPMLIHAHLGYTLKLFEDAGYDEQYILMMIGKTGSKKTTLTRVMFNLFGGSLANFTHTDRAIELSMMSRQDSTLIFDDLPDGKNTYLAEKFEKVLRQLGDSTGRRRSINGGNEQDKVGTRCAVVLTAEDDIDALSESSKLRTLAVNVNKDSLYPDSLSLYKEDVVQSHASSDFSKLEQYMTLYVQFLEINYVQIVQDFINERIMPILEQFIFARQTMIFRMMRSQLRLMIIFWRNYIQVSDEEFLSVYNLYSNILSEVIRENEQRAIQFEPFILFLQVVKHVVTSTRNIVQDKNQFIIYSGAHNGYWDGENLMIKRDWLDYFVSDYYRKQGKIFPDSLQNILNVLYELNIIEGYEQKGHKAKLCKQVRVNNISEYFICFRWANVEATLNQVEYNRY